jgi:hypothetical protein
MAMRRECDIVLEFDQTLASVDEDEDRKNFLAKQESFAEQVADMLCEGAKPGG